MTDNKILNAVHEIIDNQTKKGIKKYGSAVNADKHTLIEWLNHFQEELADALVYAETIKQKLTCPECNGSGTMGDSKYLWESCHTCGGGKE